MRSLKIKMTHTAKSLASTRGEACLSSLPAYACFDQNNEKILNPFRLVCTCRASSSGSRSAPIDMDPRKEHNKVRMQLAGNRDANKDRSPYGTPKGGRSPLFSPLVGNAAQVYP